MPCTYPRGYCLSTGHCSGLGCSPFVAWGLYKLKKLSSIDLSFKPLVGLMAAVVFIISCMPIPVPTAGMLPSMRDRHIRNTSWPGNQHTYYSSGIFDSSPFLLAHGGLTTWGADIVSMGVMGSFAGFFTFRVLRLIKVNIAVSGPMAVSLQTGQHTSSHLLNLHQE